MHVQKAQIFQMHFKSLAEFKIDFVVTLFTLQKDVNMEIQ